MDKNIKKALDCLEKADYAGYFDELDKIDLPISINVTHSANKKKFTTGKYNYETNFDQQLLAFAREVDKYLSENFKQKSSILNYIEENTVLKLIEDDINFVFDILKDVFDEEDEKYSKLKKQDFSNSTYRNQLERFIKSAKKDLVIYFKSDKEDQKEEAKAPTDKFDKEYELLRKLNFTQPLKYFRHLSSDDKKTLFPFIIRGNGNGEKWLYNNLIHDCFERFKFNTKPFIIDFGQRHIDTFEKLLDELCNDFKIEGFKNKPLRKKKVMLKNQLLEIMNTTSQIMIFKGACTSLAEDFKDFHDILVSISDEIEESKYVDTKCIMLLIENGEHKLSNHEDKFIFLSKTPARKAKKITELKFIDLDFITPMTINCIEDWLDDLPKDILDCIDCDDEYVEKIISNCDGHPDKVIPEVCKLINIDFEQKRNSWLKF